MTLNFLRFLTDGRLFLSMFMFPFAEGAAALGGGDGAAAAVIAGTTGEEGAQGEGAEAVATEGAEGVTEGEQIETAPEGEAEKPAVAAPQIDGRQVPAAIRKHLADLKTTNPQMAKELNDYVWGYKNLKADIAKNFGPEGLKEAIALKQTVEELTGADSIEDFRTEVQELRGLDQQFIAGDPEFIKTAVAKFPEGFKKLAPAMMDMWAEKDPDAYDRRMSGIIVATLGQNNFGYNLNRSMDELTLAIRIADPAEKNAIIESVISKLGENQKAITGWDQFAKSKPRAPEVDPNAAANAQRQADLDKREANIFAGSVTKDLDVFSTDKIGKELAALKKNVPESARQVFDKQVIDAVWVKMREEPNFNPKLRALMANKDHAGVMKFLKSKSELHYADAVDAAYKRIYGTTKFAGQKKPAPAAGAKPGAPSAPGQKPAAGWVKFNPPPNLIDRKATSERDIVFGKKAILTDGRKVFWGEKIPV